MQVIPKQGTTAYAAAVDKDGLDIAVPKPTSWQVTGAFNIEVSPDGLSAAIIPTGETTTGALVVTAANLTVTADLTYTSDKPIEREAVKLNLTFVDNPPPVDTPVPAPAPATPTPIEIARTLPPGT